jgi:hypothetical protein
MGTGSFPRVKRLERGVDHPPTSSAEVKERVELYLYSPSGPSWPCYRVNFIFTFTFIYIYIHMKQVGLPPLQLDFTGR